ncbi:MAG: transposase [Gemmataceae bacterium]
MTQCNDDGLLFQALAGHEVVARFDGGKVTSDAGGLLLREVEARFGFVQQFARCFHDGRDPELVEHTLDELLTCDLLHFHFRIVHVESSTTRIQHHERQVLEHLHHDRLPLWTGCDTTAQE